MSDNKNHKKAIQAIIEAHRTKGMMREIMLQVLADKPSAIVNAWEVVKPKKVRQFKCGSCHRDISYQLTNGLCVLCSSKIS